MLVPSACGERWEGKKKKSINFGMCLYPFLIVINLSVLRRETHAAVRFQIVLKRSAVVGTSYIALVWSVNQPLVVLFIGSVGIDYMVRKYRTKWDVLQLRTTNMAHDIFIIKSGQQMEKRTRNYKWAELMKWERAFRGMGVISGISGIFWGL